MNNELRRGYSVPIKVHVNSIDALIYILDLASNQVIYANEPCIKVFGNITGCICDTTLHENIHIFNNRFYHFDEGIIHWDNGPIAKVHIGTDITTQKKLEAELKAKEAKIKKLSYFDTLTELPNRTLLKKHLYDMVQMNDQNAYYGALLFLDLDQFKSINDTKGHDAGDKVLIETAKRIRNLIQPHDILSRTSGDEFFVLINTYEKEKNNALAQITLLAKSILDHIQKPYFIEDKELFLSASIGIALFKDEKNSIDDLLKFVYSAMHNAKSKGRNTFEFFDPKIQQMIENKVQMIECLRKAIDKQLMTLVYQPQMFFDNDSVQCTGVEALIRWNDTEYGIISPGKFIPIAEESGLIIPLGEWVIREAVNQLVSWCNDPIKSSWRISVNVSYKQFEQDDFVVMIKSIIQNNNIQPEKLRLELTESLLIKNTQEALEKINLLKSFGLSLSIDDFGTGYSSLSYLKQLPIDELKIDQSFIRDLATDPNDIILVETILSIGQKFGFEVIAEGVETKEQYELLGSMGCKYFQGYLFGAPVGASCL